MTGVTATEAATLAGQWGERAALAVHVATRQAVAPLDVADAAAAGAYECAVMAAHCAGDAAPTYREGDVLAADGVSWTLEHIGFRLDAHDARPWYRWRFVSANGRSIWRQDVPNAHGGVAVVFRPWNGGAFRSFDAALEAAQS